MPQSDLSAFAALSTEMQVLRAQVASLVTAGINPPPPPPAPSAALPAASVVVAAPTVAAPSAATAQPVVNPPSAACADPLLGSFAANATGDLAGKFLGGTIQEDLRKSFRRWPLLYPYPNAGCPGPGVGVGGGSYVWRPPGPLSGLSLGCGRPLSSHPAPHEQLGK
jgi:hypothetical protein